MQHFSEVFARPLFVAQHVSGVVQPIIRSIKLYTQPLPDHDQQRYFLHPATYAKPEAACAVLGS